MIPWSIRDGPHEYEFWLMNDDKIVIELLSKDLTYHTNVVNFLQLIISGQMAPQSCMH